MPNLSEKPDSSQIRAELQRLILEAFGESLPYMPTDVPILDLGISSLALVEGMRRVYDRFGVLVSIRRVIEGQITIGSLAMYIEEELKNAQNQQRLASAARGEWKVEREVPLAASQQHIAFLCRYSDEASAAFNESLLVRLNGELHAPALQAALEEAATRYEALRTALNPEGNSLQIGSGQTLELRVSPVPAGQVDAQLVETVSLPFDSGKRLFRAELLRLSDGEHILALVGHALVLDQSALTLVLATIAELYGVFARDEQAPAAPACLQWSDYLALGAAAAAQQARETSQQYWQEQFANGLPRLELPADHARPVVKKYSGFRQSVSVDPALAQKLNAWAKSRGFSPLAVLLSAGGIYLQRLASAPALVLGVESAPLYPESGLPSLANTRNLLPLRSDYDARRNFADQVAYFAALLDAAEAHRYASLSELIQHLNIPRDQSRSPLFAVAFRAIDLGQQHAFDGLQTNLLLPPGAGARYDLELLLVDTPSGLSLACDASAELFEPGTVSRWLTGTLALLDAALDDPARACGLLPMLTPTETDRVLKQWNRTEKTLPERTVLDIIAEQSKTRRDQPALRFGDQILTYAQMLARTDEIAAQLHTAGVGRTDRVGVFLRRAIDLVPALLAVWRVGAAYVPLDTAFPRSRITFMLADADVRTVVTTRDLLPLLETTAPTLCLDTVTEASPTLPTDLLPARPGDSAYIMFTSGSTGKPKGVEIRHRSLLNILLAVKNHLELNAQSHMLALTTFSFDISTVELFAPLMAGGLVEVGEDGLAADGIQLAEQFDARHPTHAQATPSTWKMVLAAGWKGDKKLCLISAGEAISRELAEALLLLGGSLWNLYGPTETTVYSTYCRITSAPGRPIRIGRPYPNTRLYILDAQFQPVPIGAVGELYIGGEGVSPGYWQRPELTAERFLPDPFLPGERVYRTGDLARYEPDGDVICLGRVDDQVKIHGVRIELGEIESALRSLPGVHDGVVTPWRNPHGDAQLVAHIIADGDIAAADLRARLRERLPEVMVPPYVLFHPSFPLTANGKVQRSALPGPDAAPATQAGHAPAPLEGGTQTLLAEAWAGVLGIEQSLIGRDSNFIDLGGHSLLMTRLMLEIRKRFQVTFNLREVFSAPTIEKFATLIDERRQKLGGLVTVGQLPSTYRDAEWARQRMAFLTRESELPPYLAPARGLSYRPGEIKTVFLTGATGFLGAYIVAEILKTTQAELYCLVRPRRGEDARLRIEKGMRNYEVWGGDAAWQHAWDTRLHIIEGDVTLPRMGLPGPLYEELARKVDAIFHGAAHVNFIYPYEALRATNVLGVHEIIQFAFHARIKPVHHLSTAAIWPMGAQYTFYERDPIDHNGLLNLGYDEAKWVGEKCLLNAMERGLPVARYRPGEVGGDSMTGHCVTDHFLLASFKGFLQFGAFPELDIEVDVAPVDYVAKAMVFLAFNRKPLGRAFHLTNPTRRRMSVALAFLRSLGYEFKELPFLELRDRLVASPNFASNALFAYQAALEDMNQVSMQLPTYDTRDTKRALEGSGITCAPADEKLFETYFRYLRSIGFIPAPEEIVTAR